MTRVRIVDRPKAEPGFPLWDRLLVAIGGLAVLLAGFTLVRSWPAYSSGPAVVGAWLVTAAAVPLVVWRIVRSGTMTRTAVAALGGTVLGVDLAVPLLLDPGLRTTLSAWNWRSGAVLICVLSAYRSAREVGALAAAHAGLAVAFGLGTGTATPASLLVLVTTSVAPPLIAANYHVVYTFGLRRRQAAVDLRTRSVALRAAEQAQRQSVLDEVESIRAQIVGLLDAVGSGRDPGSGEVRAEARALSAALRRELDESRSRGWLLAAPGVDVLGPVSVLDDDQRAALAALVDLLGRHPGLTDIVVSVSVDHGGDPVRAEVTVVATGRGSAPAHADPAIRAAVEGLGAALWHDAEGGSVVVEVGLPVAAGRLGEGRPEGPPVPVRAPLGQSAVTPGRP